MQDTARNWLRSSQGYRYSNISKELMFGIVAYGGEQTAKFVAANNGNGSASSRRRF